MRFIYIVSLIIFNTIVLMGCFEEKQEKNYTETFYSSGVLKSKKWFRKEGIFIDTAYYYYENGKISSIDILNDSGMLNGVSKLFYENGNLYQSIPYKNGVQEGFVYEYTNQGNLYSKVFYLNNTQVGDCFWYYNKKNHSTIQYSFFDFRGHNLNLITYDSITGKVEKEMYQDIFIDSVMFNTGKRKDSLNIQLLISNPPFRRSIIIIDFLSKSGRIIKSDCIIGLPYFLINQKMSDSLFSIKFKGIQYDTLTGEIQTQLDKKFATKACVINL